VFICFTASSAGHSPSLGIWTVSNKKCNFLTKKAFFSEKKEITVWKFSSKLGEKEKKSPPWFLSQKGTEKKC